MKLENQCTSLELSKRLKELGVKQESLFYHYDNRLVGGCYEVLMTSWDLVSAFTASELLELMPLVNGSPFQLIKGYRFAETEPSFCGRYDMLPMHYSTMESLPDRYASNALAKMLIYLIEEGIVKV